MEGQAVLASSRDICMLEQSSEKGVRSEEETDQLERSRKNSKTVLDVHGNSVECVMETQVDFEEGFKK